MRKIRRGLLLGKGLIGLLLIGAILTTTLSYNFLTSYAETKKEVPAEAQNIINKYVNDFVVKGYSPYYTLNKVNINVQEVSYNSTEDQIEAEVAVTMNNTLKVKKVEDLPHVKGMNKKVNEIEDKDSKEISKKIIKETTSRLQQYIGKSEDSNFCFKYVANVSNDKLIKNSAKLYFQNEDHYIPAELILPQNESDYELAGYQEMKDKIVGVAANTVNAANIITTLTTNSQRYDRIKARDYANKYSSELQNMCPHGTIQADRFWNNAQYPITKLYSSIYCHNDCADYLSQALFAGGIPQTAYWKTRNTTWNRANDVARYMVDNGYFYKSNFTSAAAGGYMAIRNSSGVYNHVMMIVQNDTIIRLYSAHTNDRYKHAYANDSTWDYFMCYN